jgi:hypothetical protein
VAEGAVPGRDARRELGEITLLQLCETVARDLQ